MINAYIRKPVTILAVEVKANDYESWLLATNFCSSQMAQDFAGPFIPVDTLDGTMKARDGDWIIRGVGGEFYVNRGDDFRATYDPASAVVDPPQVSKPASISDALGNARSLVIDQLAPGRETSLIVTKIDEALLWWTLAQVKTEKTEGS